MNSIDYVPKIKRQKQNLFMFSTNSTGSFWCNETAGSNPVDGII